MPRFNARIVARKRFTVSADMLDSYGGICLVCGDVTPSGVEPDAEGYRCEECGAPAVCGIGQAVGVLHYGVWLTADKVRLTERSTS